MYFATKYLYADERGSLDRRLLVCPPRWLADWLPANSLSICGYRRKSASWFKL